MRIACALTLVAVTGVATAGPVATLRADVDGDGAADTIELGTDGLVRIAGQRSTQVRVAPDLTAGTLAVSRARGRTLIVVELSRAGSRAGVVLDAAGTTWREVARTPLGGVGLDGDYGHELDATPAGLYRYQTRAGLRRCDGKPGYAFAEGFDGIRFRRLTAVPSGVPAGVPVLPARVDAGGPPALPLLYQARVASLQPGVEHAGALSIPTELDDGRLDTGWREELTASAGEGQFFTFEPRVPAARARQLRIVPGDPTSIAAMTRTNRPRRIAIVTAQRQWRAELPDAATGSLGTAYVVDLPDAVEGCVTVILESTHGAARGTTAIAELELYADGERAAGGDAMLARIVADGNQATSAAAALARRGAVGVAAVDAELARTSDPATRRRLIAVLVKLTDPSAAASLARAATERWATGPVLLELIDALGRHGLFGELHALAQDGAIALEARVAAAAQLAPTDAGLAALIDLAGTGPSVLRRAVIEQLSKAAPAALAQGARAQADPAAAGDVWRALTRHARAHAPSRADALTAMTAALATATDYERRYRLVDGVASLGDVPAMATLAAFLRALPAGARSSALRQVAAQAIATTPRPAALRLLVALATDGDPGVRLAVLGALAGVDRDAPGPWHTDHGPDRPEGVDRVIANALSVDTWPEVRRRAAAALGARCRRPGPARSLADAVQRDPSTDVRVDALGALVQCRATGVAAQLAQIWDDAKAPIELRSQAVGLAVELADPALGIVLVARFSRWRGAAIESAAALVLAQRAASSIARLGAAGAAEALVAALDDEAFPEIVSASALALGSLGPRCPVTARAKLRELARRSDQAAVAARRAAAQCGR